MDHCVQIAELLSWTCLTLQENGLKGCTANELMAVLQMRDAEEVIMVSDDINKAIYFL